MTPIEALNLLYQAARMAALPAGDHEKVQEAARLLDAELTPPVPADPDE